MSSITLFMKSGIQDPTVMMAPVKYQQIRLNVFQPLDSINYTPLAS
jgi:hypothetical protein